MTDTSHLNALENNLFNEEQRLAAANTKNEIKLRKVFVAQLEREIESEKKFLGFEADDSSENLSVDELLEALAA